MKLKDLVKIEGFEKLGDSIKELNSKLETKDIQLLINDTKNGDFVPRDRIKLSSKEAELLKKELDDLKEKTKDYDQNKKDLISFEEKYNNLNKEVSNKKIEDILGKIEGLKDIELFKMLAGEDKLKLNEEGSIDGLEELIKEVKESKPILFSDDEKGDTSENEDDKGGVIKDDEIKEDGDFLRSFMQGNDNGRLEFTTKL